MRALTSLVVALGLALLAPLAGAKDEDKEPKGAGGSAAEHRSEQAGESSNPQWSEDAVKGQERAAERRSEKAAPGEHGARGKQADVAAPPPAKERKAKAPKKSKKR
jgi:hypothetical protein